MYVRSRGRCVQLRHGSMVRRAPSFCSFALFILPLTCVADMFWRHNVYRHLNPKWQSIACLTMRGGLRIDLEKKEEDRYFLNRPY